MLYGILYRNSSVVRSARVRRSILKLVVIHYGISRLAPLQRRSIDYERLYRASRLSECLICTVKGIPLILLRTASDYGNHAPGLVVYAGA